MLGKNLNMTTTMTSKRERRLSVGSTPISSLQGPVGPGFSRMKHKRTFTGFGAQEINAVESSIPEPQRDL